MINRGVLFLYRLFHDLDRHHHLLQKMEGQMEAFIQAGYVVDNLYLGQDGMYFNGSLRIKRSLRTPYQKYKYFLRQFFRDVETIIQHKNYRSYYIRHFAATHALTSFLSKKKKHNPDSIILLEIPTYPYEAEYQGLIEKTALYVDRYYRKKLHPFVDYIIHFGHEATIWNIPCICIENGVIIPEKPAIDQQEECDEMVFIAIGNVAFWWGLNDFITALHKDRDVVQKRKIKLIIVGEGREKKSLKFLVEKFNLEELVAFVPYSKEERLEKILKRADIGIGTLAMHKKNLLQTSSLKHRMYAAYGLPFVYRGEDPDFENQKWTFGLEKHEKISIQQIIAWYDRLQLNQRFRQEIHAYASQNLSWTTKMQPVLKKLIGKNRKL